MLVALLMSWIETPNVVKSHGDCIPRATNLSTQPSLLTYCAKLVTEERQAVLEQLSLVSAICRILEALCPCKHSLDAGEEPSTGIVAGITPGQTTLVTCVEDVRLDFQVSLGFIAHLSCACV